MTQIVKQSLGETKEVKSTVKDFFGRLSRGLMLPISMLPIAGIMIGIGSILTDSSMIPIQWLNIIGLFFSYPGKIVFSCLPMLFAVSITVTFTKDSGPAGVCAILGWIIFNAFQYALIITNSDGSTQFLFYSLSPEETKAVFTTNLGIESLSTSVFGGITIGTVTAYFFNKFKNIQLPKVIGFFSGIRFIPILLFAACAVLSLLFALIWPMVGIGLYNLGIYMSKAPGGLNSFFIAFMNRALLPFGLHFCVTTLVNYTVVGGVWHTDWQSCVYYNGEYLLAMKAGDPFTASMTWQTMFSDTATQYTGENLIQWALISDVGTKVDLYDKAGTLVQQNVHLTVDMIYKGAAQATQNTAHNLTFIPGQYTSGASSVIMFCLPVAALAMLHCADKGDGHKIAGSILISSAVVSFTTGITEPIEFTFLFIAPWLFWGFHAIMYGVAAMINTIFILYTPVGPHVIGSCFIDDVFYSLIPEIKGGGINLWVTLLIGVGLAPIYYVVFVWAIKRFNLATPGRMGNTKLFTKKDYAVKVEAKKGMNTAKANEVIQAYGGKDNITDIGACFTKLRVHVKDASIVNKEKLKELGASGVISPSSKSVYAVFGTEADVLKNIMNDIIKEDNDKKQ